MRKKTNYAFKEARTFAWSPVHMYIGEYHLDHRTLPLMYKKEKVTGEMWSSRLLIMSKALKQQIQSECKMLKIIVTEVQLLSRRLKLYDTLFAKNYDFSLICLQGTVAMNTGKMPYFIMALIYWRVQLILVFFYFFFNNLLSSIILSICIQLEKQIQEIQRLCNEVEKNYYQCQSLHRMDN